MNAKTWILFIMCLVFLCGCGQATENDIIPTPNVISEGKDNIFETGEGNTVTLPDDEPGHQETAVPTEVPEYLKPQENIDYVKYDAANRYRSWDGNEDMSSLFHVDLDTGVVYFINQTIDWYIYRLADGKAELVVELPARELYVLNGKIYFILEDYDRYKLDGLTEGDIYACTIATGKVEKVFSPVDLEGEIYRMKPYEDGIAICCRIREEISEVQWKIKNFYYYYTFEDDLVEADPYKRSIPGWKEYYISLASNKDNVDETSLWNRKEHENKQINFEFRWYRSFVMEDMMYGVSGTRCCIYNLLTGEHKIFDINAIIKELVPVYGAILDEAGVTFGMMEAFTVTKDYLWFSVGNFLLQLDPASGEAKCYMLRNHTLRELYTDGINVYGTYMDTKESSGPVVRVCIEKEEGYHDRYQIPMIGVEYLTK